jgi:hypothetical protein
LINVGQLRTIIGWLSGIDPAPAVGAFNSGFSNLPDDAALAEDGLALVGLIFPPVALEAGLAAALLAVLVEVVPVVIAQSPSIFPNIHISPDPDPEVDAQETQR